MTTIVLTVLALYHLVGLKHAPFKASLEHSLQPNPVAVVQAAATPVALAPVKQGTESLQLGAAAVYAVDLDTGTPIVSVNATRQLPIASLTKITTALVLLETHASNEVITVPAIGPYSPDDALLHITPGQKFSFENLLAAALIPSDNDAAEALAQSDSVTISAFSGKMNRLVAGWGIAGAHYVSASGLTDADNYATAEGLAKLAKLGLANPLFARLTSTQRATITDLAGQSYSLQTTNKLFSRTTGVKTGYTAASGECFVGLATIRGHRVITVVLGSADRFGETNTLIDYIERNFAWQ